MSFHITFLGSSGGPLEGTTCSILIKPAHISYSEIITSRIRDQLLCIDAGAGLSLLTEIIHNELTHAKPYSKLTHMYYSDSFYSLDSYSKAPFVTPFANLHGVSSAPLEIAQLISHSMKSFLISHAHLDHVAALVINSSSYNRENPRNVFGSGCTISALQKYIFNGIIWPNLPKFSLINLLPRQYNQQFAINNDNYTVTMFELSHGKILSGDPKNCDEFYQSSAFLITYSLTSTSILVFGDFESDVVSKLNNNYRIWFDIAPLIISGNLSTIILECANHSCSSESELYGHLRPDHLIYEMKQLNMLCLKWPNCPEVPLKDFHIIVNHVKEPILEHGEVEILDPRRSIIEELDRMNEIEGLGIKFSIALSGVSYVV